VDLVEDLGGRVCGASVRGGVEFLLDEELEVTMCVR